MDKVKFVNYINLSDSVVEQIKQTNKIINVDYLDKDLIETTMFNDSYFHDNKSKKKVVEKMLEYVYTDKDKNIYKKTDYICNNNEKICICNLHADDFRKIYDGINYKQNMKYGLFVKK